jgi:hypothetical protein
MEAANENVGTKRHQQSEADSQESKDDHLQSGPDQGQSGNNQEEPVVHLEESEQSQHNY